MQRSPRGRTAVAAAAVAFGFLPVVGNAADAAPTPCADCFAAIRANGTLVRGRGVASTRRISEGVYRVRFSKPVTRCVFTTSISAVDGITDGAPAFIWAELAGDGATKEVFVEIRHYNQPNIQGRDLPWVIVVTC